MASLLEAGVKSIRTLTAFLGRVLEDGQGNWIIRRWTGPRAAKEPGTGSRLAIEALSDIEILLCNAMLREKRQRQAYTSAGLVRGNHSITRYEMGYDESHVHVLVSCYSTQRVV